jgi:dTDP-4-amino-4,6-dideoxygalactose transaminase
MALMAYDIGPGDAVFTTPFTFVATAEVISLLGATPVFVDNDEKTYNISPEQLKIKIQNTIDGNDLNPKAIIPVDLFGLPADYEKLRIVTSEFNLPIIEDGAQSFGASINDKKACSFGDVSTTSFFPAKPLGGYGDGGAIFTNNLEIKEKLESIRVHGKGDNKYNNVRLGINGRLDSIQAAILLEKLKIFDDELYKRQNVAQKYSQLLYDNYTTPHLPECYSSAWAQYSILANDEYHREECMEKMSESGIPLAIYYPIPLHLQKAYKYLNYNRGDLKISEEISNRIFSLPMHPYLEDSQIEKIAKVLI